MEETRFSDIGKIEAINRLYRGTPYKPFHGTWFEAQNREYISSTSCILLEGIDFNLVYFPLQHLGYKSVLAVTGQLYAEMNHPATLSVCLGVSAKLDFQDIEKLWSGIVAAAKEHGYKELDLDLTPSRNGLVISMNATGECSLITGKRRPEPKSKDLICVSGSLGAAYLGMRVLEKEIGSFENDGLNRESLEKYKMFVGSYLKPELNASTVKQLEDAEIYPSMGYFVNKGLADTVKKLSRDSGLGVKIYADKIPFEGNTFQLGQELDIDPISAAMNGGDDYKVLFTVPILSLEKFRREFQTFDIIGHLAQTEAGTTLVLPDGVEMPIHAQGWEVF